MYAVGSSVSLLLGPRWSTPFILIEPEDPPVNTGVPVIVGAGSVDFSLTVTTGEWTGEPSEYRYQWLRNGVPISAGGNGVIYDLVEEDVGKLIGCIVTAINEFGETDATSLPVGPIVGTLPVNSVAPFISGGSTPPLVGETLTANVGTWTGVPTPVFHFQWKSAGTNISGAITTTYQLQASDTGDLITVLVQATNSAGSGSATSAAVGPIVAGDDAVAPVLSAFSVDPDGEAAALMSVITDEGNGTFYWVVLLDGATTPNGIQIVAGTDGDDNLAVASGSLLVSSIDTYGNNPAGLSAGTVYDAYGVIYDAAGNASNVVTDQFTTTGSDVPVLSAASVPDFSDIFAWSRVTTNISGGSLYAVVVPELSAPPTAAQIVAGTDAADAPVPNGNAAVTGIGSRDLLLRGLTAGIQYKIYSVQRIGGTDSNIVNVLFISDVLVAQFATAGTGGGLTPSAGSAVLGTNQADPHGGTNAVRWTDNNDAATGGVLLTTTSITYFNGINKFHVTAKHVGGAQWLRMLPGNITTNPSGTHWNTAAGALGTSATGWTPTPVIFDMGSGWWMFSGQANLAGSDRAGVWNMHKGMVNNNIGGIVRDGTHSMDLYNVRITRPI
jgi:hypothetical protein